MYKWVVIGCFCLSALSVNSAEISFESTSFSFKTDFSLLEQRIANPTESSSTSSVSIPENASMRTRHYYNDTRIKVSETIEALNFNQLYYQYVDCNGQINCASFQQGFISQFLNKFSKPFIDAKNSNKVNNEAVMCMVGALKHCENKLSEKTLDFVPVMIVITAESYSEESIGAYAAILVGNETKQVVDVFLLKKPTRRTAKKLGAMLATEALKVLENNL